MEGLLRQLLQLSELQEMVKCITGGQLPALVTGLGPVHRSQAAAAAARACGRPLLVICSDERECERMQASGSCSCTAPPLPAANGPTGGWKRCTAWLGMTVPW